MGVENMAKKWMKEYAYLLHFLVSFRISFFMYNKKPPALNGQLSQEFVKNCTFANAYHRPM